MVMQNRRCLYESPRTHLDAPAAHPYHAESDLDGAGGASPAESGKTRSAWFQGAIRKSEKQEWKKNA